LFDEKAITVFLPVDEAWSALGLTEKYLLSESAGGALEQILLYGILKGVHYSHTFSSQPQVFKTLSGERVSLRLDGDTLTFDNLNLQFSIDEKDILSSNGVAHSLSAVPIPPSVVISHENLINATGSSKWLAILKTYKTIDYLDPSSNYTLFVPTDEALESLPLSSMTPETIKSLILQHIIPPVEGRPPILLTDTPAHHTTLSGTALSIRKIYSDVWTVTVDSQPSSRVLDHGITTTGAQVILLDRAIVVPERRWKVIQFVGIGILGIALSVGVASGVRYLVIWWIRRREMKPLFDGGDEESEPFLNGTS
jgi:uncharacterized surface protein with fasciclin (FAS1) repeats